MNLIFWQNCLSPHQLPYIERVIDDNRVERVVLCANEQLNDTRKNMGWENFANNVKKGFDIVISPSAEQIEMLLSFQREDTVHLFSGIRGFQFVFQVFKKSLKYKIKRGIITEIPNTFAFGFSNAKPLWLHKLRFFIQDRRFIPYIDYIFAIGEECADYYKSISTKWKIIPFAYCTSELTEMKCEKEIGDISIIYVGTLAWWKSVNTILECKKNYPEIKVNLVGDGPMRSRLEDYIEKNNIRNVKIWGFQKHCDIPSFLEKNDVLILPSIYDGWGAVINEAMIKGLYVICSNKCGAKDLLQTRSRGLVFSAGNSTELSKCLEYVVENISEIRNNRILRQKWANSHIGGRSIATYMVDCLSGKGVDVRWNMGHF